MSTVAKKNDIDLLNDPQIRGNKIIEDFNQLRETDPVHWSDQSHCWMITRHKDVEDGFKGKYPLINGGRSEAFGLMSIPPEDRAARIPNLNKYIPYWVTENDPPEHTRLRKLLLAAFSKKVVEKTRPFTKDRIDTLFAKIGDSGGEVEFHESIARGVAGFVIFKLIGIPEEHFPSLRKWSNAMVECFTTAGPTPEMLEQADWAAGEINTVIEIELEKRQKEPKDDLLTALLDASEDGDKLAREELLGAMHILFTAGQESTSNTMTLGLEALSRHPHAWQYMYENPNKIMACVNELMRYVAMSGGQSRIVSEDFEWHGKQLKKGDLVMLSIMGANRDPRVFANPEKLDFTRDNVPSQVFAPGLHHCIGHMLAKMELCEVFTALVNQFESAEILDDNLDFMKTYFFRGLFSMNVRLKKRK